MLSQRLAVSLSGSVKSVFTGKKSKRNKCDPKISRKIDIWQLWPIVQDSMTSQTICHCGEDNGAGLWVVRYVDL